MKAMEPVARKLRIVLALFVLLSACRGTDPGDNAGITPDTHRWFPINAGTNHAFGRGLTQGSMACASCHYQQSNSFTDFTCTSCHEHEKPLTDQLHLGVTRYTYTTTSCFSCHTAGERGPFDHAGITGNCASCHQVGAPFAALPVAGFTHAPIASDCGACHSSDTWGKAAHAPVESHDPSRNVTVTAQIPSYASASIIQLTEQVLSLRMLMDHGTTQVPADTLANCAACHPNASGQGYFPGILHASLATQPTGCASCHSSAAPAGFVGPAALSPRSPASAEMKHDAVAWAAGSPTAAPLVQEDCATCHTAPTEANPATWASGVNGSSPAKYHSSLQAAGRPQPASCIDCHANSRPVAKLTSANASLPASLEYDHQQTAAMGDCGPCHSAAAAAQWTSWTKGRFHLAGSGTPSTCLPCHEAERPKTIDSWQDPTFASPPFDYVGTPGSGAKKFNHGNSLDCVGCHAGPGSGGAWEGTQTWIGGFYDHAAQKPASCLPCHTSQRPAQLVGSFDHQIAGTGECLGCHRATVTRGRFVDLTDWRDGQPYPSDSLVAAPGQFVSVTTLTLTRDANNRVTGMTPSSTTLDNAMKHTSEALPAALSAGLTPDYQNDFGKCWHCHTSTGGTVTNFTDGVLHEAFAEFRATPGGAVAPLSPPRTCLDCHEQMRPPNVVEKSGSALVPMDHSARFKAPATIGGGTVTSVAQLDCAVCHSVPGTYWADGEFHTKIGSAEPEDCVACHYPLLEDAAKSDVASTPPTRYAMRHRSSRLTAQECQTCHPQALGKASARPSEAALWRPGVLHAALATQPSACNDCHSVTAPASRTQSSETYSFSKGGTTTNSAQWMSHSASVVAGKDCVLCHAADATKTGWSKSLSFHAATPGITTCNACHGGGSSPGSGNNMPSGLTDSATITTSSAAAANTHDQITHADVNVTSHECGFCHTQAGSSTAAGIQGKEWAQALFHESFSASIPLVVNGTTGRCSHCHMNVKPGASFTAFDHSPYTETSAQDCSACHAWPGTSASKPNWLGAKGAHASSGSTAASTLDCNTCHGQSGSATHRLAVAASSHYGGVTNGNTCTSCHINFAGFKDAVANLQYKHTNAAANSGGCGTCHAFANQVYTTLTTTPSLTYPVSAGGHTFSQTRNVTGSFDGDSFSAAHNASSMTSCGACHQYSTTTSSTNVWTFKHNPKNPGISNSRSSGGCKNCH
jgi:hypothetical protein